MALGKIARLVFASAVAMALALVAGAQALSSVSVKTNPALAAELFPANGRALANLAFADYATHIVDPAAPPPPTPDAVELAREAVSKEPLSTKAYVVLAQAEQDPARRRAIIEAASKLDRRDIALQGLVLQERLADQDYEGTIKTLDQILRVHPKRSQEFFPVLASALADESTIPLFADMLDGSSRWHLRFLKFALSQPQAVTSLASLRPDLKIADEDFDRRLIASLVQNGEIDAAGRLYKLATVGQEDVSSSGALDWRTTYPPFDWALSDKAEFRAQVSRDGTKLELYVKPGQGGVIALRLLAVSPEPFFIELKHALNPVGQLEDVQILLGCAGDSAPIVNQRLRPGTNRIGVDRLPENCRYISVGIQARAWTGEAPLSGTIDEIAIRPVASSSFD